LYKDYIVNKFYINLFMRKLGVHMKHKFVEKANWDISKCGYM